MLAERAAAFAGLRKALATNAQVAHKKLADDFGHR